jgi:hypothetical protein
VHVGQRLVDRLVAHGIHRVFGVPGGQTSPLYHAIGQRQDEIRHVLMRDERSAAFAADACGRTTGWVGVCDATVGPGASNLVSGLLEAYTSSVPLLAIAGDILRTWETRRRLGSASQGFPPAGVPGAPREALRPDRAAGESRRHAPGGAAGGHLQSPGPGRARDPRRRLRRPVARRPATEPARSRADYPRLRIAPARSWSSRRPRCSHAPAGR